MLSAIVLTLAAAWIAAAWFGRERGDLAQGPYPDPDAAVREIEELSARHPTTCRPFEIGRSGEGRTILACRLRAPEADDEATRPRLLVTAQIHAIEFVGSLVARSLMRRIVEGYGRNADATALLDAADVIFVPLLNPDGATRVWRAQGRVRLAKARMTARDVDPNRNFPFDETITSGGWNAASTRPGSPYYRGPHPLSEPECAALAALAIRERFCGAVHFHSIGAVVYLPEATGPDAARARHVLATFEGPFQARQRHRAYRPVLQGRARTLGQLDPFLLDALGTPSVTIEVSRPRADVIVPWYATRLFWWANPPAPRRWIENDVDATLFALQEILARSGGTPCRPAREGNERLG
jgi:hypothetical protein